MLVLIAIAIGLTVFLFLLIIPSQVLTRALIFCLFALVGGVVSYVLFTVVGGQALTEEAIAVMSLIPAFLVGQIATDQIGTKPPERSRSL